MLCAVLRFLPMLWRRFWRIGQRGCVLGICYLFLFSGHVEANQIKIIVNDKPITSYDIQQRAKLLGLISQKPESAVRKIAEDELIEAVLKKQEAEKRRISVTQQEVQGAFAFIAQRSQLSPQELQEALLRSGASIDSLMDRLMADLLWRKLLQGKFQATVKISSYDISHALKKRGGGGKAAQATQYNLTQISFVVPKNATTSEKAQRQREVEALRRRFTSCAQGIKMAEGLKEVLIKPLGKRMETEVPPPLREPLKKTQTGRLTEIFPGSPNTLDVIAVCEKEEVNSDVAMRDEVEAELRSKQGQLLAHRYLQELRRQAIIEYR